MQLESQRAFEMNRDPRSGATEERDLGRIIRGKYRANDENESRYVEKQLKSSEKVGKFVKVLGKARGKRIETKDAPAGHPRTRRAAGQPRSSGEQRTRKFRKEFRTATSLYVFEKSTCTSILFSYCDVSTESEKTKRKYPTCL